MPEPVYLRDLTNAEWQIIAATLLPEKRREVALRQVVDAIFGSVDNDIKWWAMPADFAVWQTVYGYYRKWVKKGVGETINAVLVEQVHTQAGRAAQPSLGMIDSQSVKQDQLGGSKRAMTVIKRSKGASVTS